MGKTGTTTWAQVKNVRGKIRLVRAQEATQKKPGPNQRFKASATLKKIAIQAERQQGRGGRGGRGGARRGGRGGRGGQEMNDQRVRRRMIRSKATAMGVKQKSR
ncbi:hypothetical protein E2N92_12085 [Methanofollis formosanus]|uniref:DUF5350 family protein n=1 Tax=Methanofollis formosanus TaxID=299308 RepID=A0A8G1A4T6_9EURY|nr:DUF5350 family protein [Methanofollis formosanus]QYZ80112.1 hypothetical protein E2N92_12085 [Methanofollis formosanus]